MDRDTRRWRLLQDMECRDGGSFATVNLRATEALLELLLAIEEHFGSQVRIHSGYRTERHNALVGGAAKSEHVRGVAADISVEGRSPVDIVEFLSERERGSIFWWRAYKGHVHVDARGYGPF